MIIFRYLSREILRTTLAMSFALMVIFVSARFVKYLSKAATGEMAGDIVFAVMMYRMPQFLELIIPLGFFLAILLSYGRLYVESEMIVMQACGVSKRRLLGYTMVPGLLITLIVGGFSLYLSPKGLEQFHLLWNDPKNFTGFSTLMPGRFQKIQHGKGVTYAEEVNDDKTRMGHIFLAGRDNSSKQGLAVVVAEQGWVWQDPDTRQRIVELERGVRYEGTPGQADFKIVEFERYGQRVEEKKAEPPPPEADAKPTQALFSSTEADDIAALQWRISVLLTVPIITLIGVSLSETNHRRGRFIKLLPGIVIYILYVITLSVSRGALEKEQIPPIIGLWWVHLVFLGIGLALFWWADIRRWLRGLWRLRSQAPAEENAG